MALTVPSHESILRPEAISKQTAAQDAARAVLAAKAVAAKKVRLTYPGTCGSWMLVASPLDLEVAGPMVWQPSAKCLTWVARMYNYNIDG